MLDTVKSFGRATLGRRGTRLARQVIGKIAFHQVELTVPLTMVGRGGDEFAIAPEALGAHPVVYAFGIGTIINADLDLIAEHNARVYAFDPTPASHEWLQAQSLPAEYVPHRCGIATFDGQACFYQHDGAQYSLRRLVTGEETEALDVRRLATLAGQLGHDRIDLLKIDIEGAEYEVIPDVLASGLDIRQIMIEFHHRLPGYRIGQTYEAVRQLRDLGYRIIAISEIGREYTFLRP